MQQQSDIDLKEFISQCKTRLSRILDRLEWTEESTLRDFNTNSVASSPKGLLKRPRPSNASTFPDSCIANNSLVLDTPKLQELLQNNVIKAPSNFKELQSNFSREEKLKIYEHVIENTKKLENNTIDREIEGEISLADILAQKKREEKRKKRRFRKSKPTHIEEVRCLVDIQMQALQQFVCNRLKKERSESTKRCIPKTEDKTKYYENDDRKERNREEYKEHHGKSNDLKRYRSRSKEYTRHKHKHQRSSSKELSYARKKRRRSRSKERRKHRSRSANKEIRYERTRRKSRSKSQERRNNRESYSYKRRSRSKEQKNHSKNRTSESNNKEMPSESRSYESSRREENVNYLKYSHGRENKMHYDYEEKCSNKKYSRKESETVCNEYKSSHSSKSKKLSTSDKDYKIIYQSNEKSSNSKSSYHKRSHREKS